MKTHKDDCLRNGVEREGESCTYNNNCTYPNCTYPGPIIKFNGGMGAILCNECRVIIKSGLTREEIQGRTHLLFCDEHYRDYIDKTEEPGWVCFECAEKRGAWPPEGHHYTVHTGTCSICKQNVQVTEPRDFGITRHLLRVWKEDEA